MKDVKELQLLYKDCMDFWGERRQLRMLQEECSELILAVSHYIRERPNSIDNVIEEIGDVQLMINQFKEYFGEDKINEVIDYKSDYVRRALEKEKKEKEK